MSGFSDAPTNYADPSGQDPSDWLFPTMTPFDAIPLPVWTHFWNHLYSTYIDYGHPPAMHQVKGGAKAPAPSPGDPLDSKYCDLSNPNKRSLVILPNRSVDDFKDGEFNPHREGFIGWLPSQKQITVAGTNPKSISELIDILNNAASKGQKFDMIVLSGHCGGKEGGGSGPGKTGSAGVILSLDGQNKIAARLDLATIAANKALRDAIENALSKDGRLVIESCGYMEDFNRAVRDDNGYQDHADEIARLIKRKAVVMCYKSNPGKGGLYSKAGKGQQQAVIGNPK